MTTPFAQAPFPQRPASHRRRRLTRRGFLAASGVVGAAGIAGGAAWASLAGSAGTRQVASTTADGGTLVLLTLYGGNDGLDTVVPAADPEYQKARGTLAVSEHDALPLADGLALHPSLVRLKRRYDAGTVAIVRGVGYPNPDHSHFRSMSIWQTASPQTPVTSGWLGRWLDATASSAKNGSSSSGPIQAVGIGATLTPALVGQRRSAAAVPTGALAVPGGALGTSIRALFQPDASTGNGTLLEAVAGVDNDYLSVADRLGPLLGTSGTGGDDLASQLGIVSRLIKAGLPTQAYAVSLGGFDTHAGEEPTHGRLLGEVDSALDTFLTSVAGSPHASRLVVMVYSEFGRRVVANASGGTDHGTAAPVILAGPGVRGGMYGDQPSLTKLGTGADDGDLIATTDFRDVYATVLSDVLAADPGPVLGTGRRSLGFIKT
ncbi:MAG TPA: DUF1501 domain-containing protein [Frankiaceae bacterium]|jgi:uncharacterized protein (DUF1501 family)|nr:DUF1501 domain-containing protein [Frankiaceae bacterium]